MELGGGQEKGTLEGYSKGNFWVPTKTCIHSVTTPHPSIVQTLVMFLLMTQRKKVSVFYTTTGIFQGTHLLCPNAPAPKCQVVPQELIHLTSI